MLVLRARKHSFIGWPSLRTVSDERDWKQYESQIHQHLLKVAGDDATIEFDVQLPGRLSGVDRQVDIYVRGSFANIGEATMAVDCKCFSRSVDVKHVETVLGLVEDVGTTIGLLVTTEGFSPAAKQRASAVRGMWLDVVPYDELADWEPDVHWCYSGSSRASFDTHAARSCMSMWAKPAARASSAPICVSRKAP